MHAKLITMVLGASLIATTACQTPSGQGAAAGAVGGGLIGGLAGGTTGLLIGAAAGSLFGYGVGRVVEEQDRRRIAYALEQDRPMSWRNPDTGYYYVVQPTRLRPEYGPQCREFRMTAEGRDRPQEVYGTACRQPDGSWQLVNNS